MVEVEEGLKDWDGVVVVVFEGDLSGNIFSGGRGGDCCCCCL